MERHLFREFRVPAPAALPYVRRGHEGIVAMPPEHDSRVVRRIGFPPDGKRHVAVIVRLVVDNGRESAIGVAPVATLRPPLRPSDLEARLSDCGTHDIQKRRRHDRKRWPHRPDCDRQRPSYTEPFHASASCSIVGESFPMPDIVLENISTVKWKAVNGKPDQNSRSDSWMPLCISYQNARPASCLSFSKRSSHCASSGAVSPSTSRLRRRKEWTKSRQRSVSQ